MPSLVYAKQRELADKQQPPAQPVLHNIVEMSMTICVAPRESCTLTTSELLDTAVTVPDDPAVLDEVAWLLSFACPSPVLGQAAATAGRPAR